MTAAGSGGTSANAGGSAATASTASASTAAGQASWTVRTLLAWVTGFLKEREVDSPRAIAEILLADTLGVERMRLYMEPDREPSADELARFRALVARAGRHEPVQFLVGRWPFLGRDFEVAPCTLIPRPCTEALVEHALAWCRSLPEERRAGGLRALDLCTGTGCIAVSVALGMRAVLRPSDAGCRPLGGAAGAAASALPVVQIGEAAGAATGEHAAAAPHTMVATDLVPEAVALAQRNAARLGAAIDFRTGDLWSALRGDETFDLVLSNPPYVTDDEYAALDRNVRDYEPASALRGGRDGLDFVRRLAAEAERRTRPGGLVLVEIGWKHRDPAMALFAGRAWRSVEVARDGEGLDRVLVAHRA
ncbi:MAG: peptide chain release factor N(5)-glutamine methyltransferase [Planctomycetota bacterium]